MSKESRCAGFHHSKATNCPHLISDVDISVFDRLASELQDQPEGNRARLVDPAVWSQTFKKASAYFRDAEHGSQCQLSSEGLNFSKSNGHLVIRVSKRLIKWPSGITQSVASEDVATTIDEFLACGDFVVANHLSLGLPPNQRPLFEGAKARANPL